MTEDYVSRRREYVAQIRNSFNTEEEEENMPEQAAGASSLFARLSLLVSVCLFVLFLYMKLTGTEVYGYQSEDIVNLITDNHYYTELSDYKPEELKAVLSDTLFGN